MSGAAFKRKPQPPSRARRAPELPGGGHVAVYGKTQFGKSTWAREALFRLVATKRIIVVDAKGDWAEWCARNDFLHLTAEQLAERPSYVRHENICLEVPDRTPKAAARAFQLAARLVHAARLDCIVVADEIGTWGVYCNDELMLLATQGLPHCRLVAIAQRPTLVLKTVRSQIEGLVAFRLDEPSDVEAVAERTRDEALAAELPSLPVGAHRVWVAGGLVQPQPKVSPQKEFHK